MEEKKNVYLTFHKNFVRTDIEYQDRAIGETKTFNQVTLPKGTTIDGVDVGCYQFSPLFVNPSKYRGDNYRDVPMLTNREVWLKKTVLDAEGNPVLDQEGKPEHDTIKVMPQQIKDALDQARTDYIQAQRAKQAPEQGLADRVNIARNGSDALGAQAAPAPARQNVRG